MKNCLGAAFEKKAFVLLLFFVFFRIEIALPQSNYSFKKIGDITWKSKGAIEPPEVLSYKKTETEELEKKIEFKKKKLYQKEIQLVSKVISSNFKEPKKHQLTFTKKPIEPSKKIAAPDFLIKDNSLFNISYLDKSHGFLSNEVSAIAEDTEHNIWIATQDIGLVKFDGNFFYVFSMQSDLASNTLNHVLYNKNVGLIISSSNGFAFVKNDSISIPNYPVDANSKLNGFTTSIDSKNNVWLNTRNTGTFKINFKQNTIQHFGKNCGLPSNHINYALQDIHNNYWFSGIGIVKIEKATIIQYNTCKNPYNFDESLKLIEQKDTIWVGTFDNCLLKITPQKVYQYSIFENFIGRVYDFAIEENKIYIGLFGGGLAYIFNNECLVFDGTNGLDFQIFQFCTDSYKNIWLACVGAGIFRINNSSIISDLTLPNYLKNAVTIKFDKDTNIWFFLNGKGLVKESKQGYFGITNKVNLPYPSVSHFFDGEFTNDGSLWLGTYSYGIAHYKNRKITYFNYSKDPKDQVILDTEIDKNQRVWFSTMNYGLLYFKGDKLHRLSTKNGLYSNDFSFLSKTKDEKLLVVSKNGIQQISNDTIFDFFIDNKPFILSPISVYRNSLAEVFICTEKQGLLLIKENVIYSIGNKNVFNLGTTWSIAEAENNYYWFNTKEGILKVKIKNLKVSDISVIDNTNDFLISKMNGVSFVDSKNRPHWATPSGFITYQKDFDFAKKNTPYIKLIGANINNNKLAELSKIELSQGQTLSIFYKMIFWGSEKFLKQKYALVNETEKDTIFYNVGEKGIIKLINLNSDNYKLYLVAEHKDINYFSTPIQLIVLPHWYKTWWFILLCAGLVFSFILFYFKFRTNRLQRSKLALEQTVKNRTQELMASLDERDLLLKEIHHRVKNNLQVISGLLELQKEDVSDELVKAALSEGQNRVRSVALIHHNLYQHESLSSLSFKSFLLELEKNIFDVFSSKKQTIEVEILGNDIILDVDTVVSLGLILNELITNAYKYAISAEKKPKVTFQITEQTVGNFSMIYQDNGPGIPKGIDFENSTSLGLRLIKGLTEQLSGTVKYSYNNGAEFIFYFKNAQARKVE